MMRNLGRARQQRVACVFGLAIGLQSAALGQPAATGLAAYSTYLTNGFFVLLAIFLGLLVWEIFDNKKASRSSLDIAKLAAAAAKKQSASGAPSGSLASLEAPSTSRPFAPPPPPPPPPAPVPKASSEVTEVSPASPFASPPAPLESSNPFAPPPQSMAPESPTNLESTVAFNPSSADAGSSGGWADLLQRVRAGEPESTGFPAPSAPPATENEVFPDQTLAAPPPASAASSSEAWEALLKRTTSGDSFASKPVSSDSGKISLSSGFGLSDSPAPNVFGEEAVAKPPAAPASFSLPGAPPAPTPAAEPPAGLGFSFTPEPAPTSSPFSLPPTQPTQPTANFEAPAFKLPGSDDSGGFQLPGGNAPFDFGASDGSSTSTLPLSDLFSSKSAPTAPPAFQLPTGSGASDPFGTSDDGGLGRTISLDFSKGGGQKPPPPLPKTEG